MGNNSKRNEINDTIRLKVLKRDGYRCVYCGAHGKDCELQVDHRVPLSKGGSNHVSNLLASCRKCNQSKGDAEWPKGDAECKCWDADEKPADPLLNGMYVLIWDNAKTEHERRAKQADGEFKEEVRYQGQFMGFEGDTAVVNTYSWFTGQFYGLEFFPKEQILDGRTKFYPDGKSMWHAVEYLYTIKQWPKDNYVAREAGG